MLIRCLYNKMLMKIMTYTLYKKVKITQLQE